MPRATKTASLLALLLLATQASAQVSQTTDGVTTIIEGGYMQQSIVTSPQPGDHDDNLAEPYNVPQTLRIAPQPNRNSVGTCVTVHNQQLCTTLR